MKHKHYDKIVAKAANMDLVVFKNDCDGRNWYEIDEMPVSEFEFSDYFLCLPQHKDACLHWLNGGEVESLHKDYEPMTLAECGSIEWGVKSTFMKGSIEVRIKPKKEKRWILVRNDSVTARNFHCKYDATFWVDHNTDANSDYWQFIEIEVEV